jgi:SWI/SNF-related matrix-associated actin-dependent regulator of chromatin subfamily D
MHSGMISKADLDKLFRKPGPIVAPQAHGLQQSQQVLQQQQMQEAQRREMGKRLARKPTDKNIPDGIADIIIGNGVEDYRKLRDVERRLDSAMMRKRLDIQDSVNRNMTRYKTMRIWISNTAENQPWQQGGMDQDAFDFNSGDNATYRVKIEGRLLDDEEDLNDDVGDEENGADGDVMEQDGEESKQKAPPAKKSPQRTKLSHFFKAINITFDRSKSLQPEGFTEIEWKKPDQANPMVNTSAEANFDCLEFERKGDENINITINLTRDDAPERFRLSKPLAELLDTEEDDRAGVMMGLWNYIKTMGLQEDEDTRKVLCDARMKAVSLPPPPFTPPPCYSQVYRCLAWTLYSFRASPTSRSRIFNPSRHFNFSTRSGLTKPILLPLLPKFPPNPPFTMFSSLSQTHFETLSSLQHALPLSLPRLAKSQAWMINWRLSFRP